MPGYSFGDFWFDLVSSEVLRAGKRRRLTGQEKAFLLLLLKEQAAVASNKIEDTLWRGTSVRFKQSIAQLKFAVNKKLGKKVIELVSTGLYRITVPITYRDSLDSPIIDTAPEIADFLKETRYGILPIGEFLPIYPVYCGLSRDEIEVKYQGEYESFQDFSNLMKRFVPTGTINELYSFHGWEGEIPSADEYAGDKGLKLILRLQGGDWRHIYALNEIRKGCIAHPPDPQCVAFRKKYVNKLIPINASPFYHNVNTEVIVVTSDDQVVIARRKNTMIFAGSWTASLEEQMLRRRKDDGLSDGTDLFGCAERGARGELGITVLSAHTRLLSIGIEFGNFTAAFLFLIRSAETFSEIASKTWPEADECDEAVALDAVPAEPRNLEGLLKADKYYPDPETSVKSPRVNALSDDPRTPGPWHPVAKARLHAYLKHIQKTQ